MTTYFSPSTLGFYSTDLHESIPDDKIEIGADEHRQLLADQAAGKILVVRNGKVRAVDPSGPSEAERVIRCKIKAQAILARTDWAVLPDVMLTEKSRDAVLAYRKAIRALAVNPVADPEWPTPPEVVWGV